MSFVRTVNQENSFSAAVDKAFATPANKTDDEVIKKQNDCFEAFFSARDRYFSQQKREDSTLNKSKIPMLEDFPACKNVFKAG